MKEIPKWVLENLCYHDKRNPLYCDDIDEDIDRSTCYCDNCFYGRTKLAEEIIDLYETNTTRNS